LLLVYKLMRSIKLLIHIIPLLFFTFFTSCQSIAKNVNIELGNSMDFKLYNLKDDPAQKNDLSNIEDKKLKEIINGFVKIRGKEFTNIKNLVLE
jgi:hypothetical protein